MSHETILYILFFVILGVSVRRDNYQHKKDKQVSINSALKETLFWICIAVVFGGLVYFLRGTQAATEYFTGYILEKSLSVDNLFVMMAIFSSFLIPDKFRHRVLYYGILGAIVLRLLFISVGTFLLSFGPIVLTIFGVIVIITAVKMLIEIRDEKEENSHHDYSQGKIAKFIQRFVPVAKDLHGHDFFTKIDGKRHATALFLALIVIELSDVLFAFDSLPAILSITQDTFIIFSSNIFAILGLRALYFVLEAIGKKLKHISYAVIAILFFVGMKMILSIAGIHIHSLISLGVILMFLTIGSIFSVRDIKKKQRQNQPN
ncbi:MAG: TerC/Alx family metal homeostasis membrane protein [Candidatus Absconditabacterales bacterium]